MNAFTQQRPSITLAGARAVIAKAHEVAQANGWHIAVAVVDHSGALIAFERDDQAIGITTDVAVGKARTAALLQAPSKSFEDMINAGCPSFLSTPGTTPLEGGVPLLAGHDVVGAVGISGAHGPNDSLVAVQAAAALNG